MTLADATLEYSNISKILSRRVGFFWRRKINLADVDSICATSDDSLTHDEIHIQFRSKVGTDLVISEFDKNFATVSIYLEEMFPGFNRWSELNKGQVFEFKKLTLWERKKPESK